MKKFSMLFLAAAVALVGAIVAPNKAEAVPAFARQVGVACYACHFQHIPKLNSFGREFKLGGFTQSAQDLITDDGLSIPPVLNASMVAKYRYQMGKNNTDTKVGLDRGLWQIYDEFAFLVGGRVAENMGTLVEFGAGVASSKFVFSKDFGGVRGGVVAFQTDGLGVGYGMELFNTGAQRNQRGFEERSFMANQQETKIGDDKYGPATGPAEGLLFFGGNGLFFGVVGLWGPANGEVDTGFDLSSYIRLAITPKVGDMDLMVGLQMTGGSSKVGKAAVAATATTAATAAGTTEYKTGSTAVDAQLQADLGGMSLEVIAAYQMVKDDTLYGSGSNANGMHLGAELGLTTHAGVKLGFGTIDSGKTGGAYTAMVIGGWYAPAQNVDLVLEMASYSGDAKPRESRTTVMLEFAF